MTTAVYMRCSSATQTTDSQRFELEQYLASRVTCAQVVWYIDQAVSGKNLDRPALKRLQQDICDGKVDTVICWKLDRLSRSIADGVRLLCDWVNRGVRIVAVTQQLDLSGAVGKMVAALLLGVAEMERENLRERQAAGIAHAQAKGVRFGRPQTIDGDQIRRMRAEGMKAAQIARTLGIARQSVYNALRTPAA